jgi:signal transduction histidine kinase
MGRTMERIAAKSAIGVERKRVEAVVETLATLGCDGESAAELAHDARNMVTALGLYCDLLEEPGVLAAPFAHYGEELRLVAAASRRLVEKLVALDASTMDSAFRETESTGCEPGVASPMGAPLVNPSRQDGSLAAASLPRSSFWADQELNARGGNTTAVERAVSRTIERVVGGGASGIHAPTASGYRDLILAAPIQDMAQELVANQNLLAALAGPSIAVSVRVAGARRPVRLTGEDLTRVMVNLVKNAAEAMPTGGSIHIELREVAAAAGIAEAVRLTFEDSGPGIASEARETIFTSGFSTRKKSDEIEGAWRASHRGLGLAITRSIVEAAGGRIQLSSEAPAGARFEIELPVRRKVH